MTEVTVSSKDDHNQHCKLPGRISLWLVAPLIFFLFLLTFLLYLNTPTTFTNETKLVINPGTTLFSIAEQTKASGLVRSADLLYLMLLLFYEPTDLKAGTYTFKTPTTTFAVAQQLATTIPEDVLISVTFPEGFSVREFERFLPEGVSTSTRDSIEMQQLEGYLFPDTYFIPEIFTTNELIVLMQENFRNKVAPLEQKISNSNLTLNELITWASLVEREANDNVSMKLVAGILKNRLNIGMPLQVDAAVAYGSNKSGTELTRADIDKDGPYNTYTRSGLPAAPIANPGLDAIEAVLEPTASDYYYYITGNDGNFYYAVTLDEHNANIANYLQ